MSKRSDTSTAEENARPRTRQRIYKPPPPIAVPDIDEDAAERKRLLNVLAQRRYRQKKRQTRLGDAASKKPEESVQNPAPIATAATETEDAAAAQEEVHLDTSMPPSDPGLQGVGALGLDFVDPQWTFAPFEDAVPPVLAPDDLQLSFMGGIGFGLDFISSNESTASLTTDGFATTSQKSPSSGTDPDSHESFPDSYLLPVNELTLLRAALRVGGRLNAGSLFDLTSSSPFILGTNPPSDQLPAAWQPTTSQLLMPHHPIIDLLPWPCCRDKILDVLSLPDDARPPAARGELALFNFVYDIEDSAEGVRIWGSDPYDDQSWEVGQVVFERWWFVFDRAVIERSNYWRQLRGAPLLRISGSAGPGSIPTGNSRVTEV